MSASVFQVGDRVRNVAPILSNNDIGTLGTVTSVLDDYQPFGCVVDFDHAPPASISRSTQWEMNDDELAPGWVVVIVWH